MAKTKQDPNEVVHLQVSEGETVAHKNISYGPRACLQVRRGDLDRVDASTPRFTRMRSPTWRVGGSR
jgi:hypothetical protein